MREVDDEDGAHDDESHDSDCNGSVHGGDMGASQPERGVRRAPPGGENGCWEHLRGSGTGVLQRHTPKSLLAVACWRVEGLAGAPKKPESCSVKQ